MKIQHQLWLIYSIIFILISTTVFIMISSRYENHLQMGSEQVALTQGFTMLERFKDTYPCLLYTSTAAHAAFARQAHLERELPGLVIEPAGLHQRVGAFGPAGREDTFTRVGYHPVVGQEQEGFGKLPAAHLDGAELEVEVHHLVDIVVDVLKRLHQVDQRVVTEAGLLFGLSHPRVELYGAVGR